MESRLKAEEYSAKTLYPIWMQVNSGGKLYPGAPEPSDLHIEDIANGLAHTCRYGGQIDIDKFYSVAEHSILLAGYVYEKTSNPDLALAMLLHDAAEAYIGDIVAPVKKLLGGTYTKLEQEIQTAIFRKYGVEGTAETYAGYMKSLDNRIVVDEKAALFSKTVLWPSDWLAPLGVKIKCLHRITAKRDWLWDFDYYNKKISQLDWESENEKERY